LTWLERLAKDKHFSLVGPFIRYDENKVLCIRTQVTTNLMNLCCFVYAELENKLVRLSLENILDHADIFGQR
jgi:hypothetical protein